MSDTSIMKAVRYVGTGERPMAVVCDVKKPQVTKPDDVLIRVEAVSICGTDTRALADPPAFKFAEGVIIGHECCGIVEETGCDVTNAKPGDRVVVHPNIWCGKCPSCRTGHINLCENFRHIGDGIDGVMADYACIPERMVYQISSDVLPHIACLAEPLACVLNGTTTFKAHPGEDVVIIGGGPIGLIFAMIYQASGARVIVSEPSESRRNLAYEIGIDDTVDPLKEDLEAYIKKINPQGVDIVVDALGTMVPTAIKIAKKGGRISVFGINQIRNVEFNQFPVTEKELKIQGTYITNGTFPLAIKMIENKIIPIEKLVTDRMGIYDVMEAVDKMNKGTSTKVIIEI